MKAETTYPRIFISYRRDDTAGHALLLKNGLQEHFGRDHVFMDIDTIEPGLDFAEVIAEGVGSCDVLLALMGKQWISASNSEGMRRLDDPNDFVRLEVTSALEREVRVIPVIVESALIPSVDELPSSLSRLARLQVFEMSDARWNYDFERLVEILQKLKGADEAPDSPAVIVLPPDEAHPGGETFEVGASQTTEGPPAPETAVEKHEPGAAHPKRRPPRRTVVLIAAAVAALVAVVVAIGLLAPAEEPEKVAFLRADGGDPFQIWVMNADRTGEEQLTTGNADNDFPTWSADGTMLAFNRSDEGFGGPYHIWVMDADGDNQRELTLGSNYDARPSWSPEGDRIVFYRSPTPDGSDGPFHIWVVDDEGEEVQLTTGPDWDTYPAWSPDGDRIAFSRSEDAPYRLWVMDADGSNPRQLTAGESARPPSGAARADDASEEFPAWSPDGTQIAFSSTADGEGDIWVVDADGRNARPLTSGPTDDQFPSWSPEGIVFQRADQGSDRYDVFVVDPDGANVRPLTSDNSYYYRPAW